MVGLALIVLLVLYAISSSHSFPMYFIKVFYFCTLVIWCGFVKQTSMCYIANPCSAAICDEQCSLHGGVCDNGVCEFRCSDYAGYTCQNSSSLLPSLSICGDVLVRDVFGQHCAPSEPSILQQLEAAVVVPNYNRLMPGGHSLFSIFDNSYCATAAKRLACWVCYLCLTILHFLTVILVVF